MSKEYARKKPTEYSLPHSLYLRVLHTVRDYPRMVDKINDVLCVGSSVSFTEYLEGGQLKRAILPKCVGGANNPTEDKAFKVMQELETVDAIDKSLKLIPIEYRQYIFENVVYKNPYPFFADKSTWSRWRMRFLYYVAEKLGWL